MNTHAKLRAYTENDAAAVKALILSILASEYPIDKAAYSDSDLDHINKTYGGAREQFFVIEEAGEVVGTIGIKEDSKDDALIRRFFVSAGHRHHGYGSRLLEHALAYATEKNYKKACFRCTDRMRDAMKLFIKKGFKETASLPMGTFNIHVLAKVL